MSDPVSSMDVEDVLSSIRRLVSEEAKGADPQDDSHDAAGEVDIVKAAEATASEAFSDIIAGVNSIMRPNRGGADGVAPAEPAGKEMSFRHQAAAEARTDEKQKLVLTAALRVATPDASTPTPTDEPKHPGASGKMLHSQPLHPERPHLHSIGGQSRNRAANAGQPGQGTRISPFNYAPEDTLFDRAKLAMDAVNSDHPAMVKRPPNAANGADVVAQTTAKPPLNQPAAESVATGEALGPNPASSHAPDREAGTEAEETMEETVSPTSPFSRSRDTLGANSDSARNDQQSDAKEETSTINFAEEEESILDEETLRELVAEMVREELQGELGDRITRNVRKLVRREIQRVLASREFE